MVRLPRTPRAAVVLRKELPWLPRLAPLLPLRIPPVLGKGEATTRYPYACSVFGWLDGEDAGVARISNDSAAARALGEFVRALRAVDADTAPRRAITTSTVAYR